MASIQSSQLLHRPPFSVAGPQPDSAGLTRSLSASASLRGGGGGPSCSLRVTRCRCGGGAPSNSSPDSAGSGVPFRLPWDSVFSGVSKAVDGWDGFFKSWHNLFSHGSKTSDSVDEWDWRRWKRYFAEVDEEEMLIATLETQLHDAVAREDFEEAAKLKAAIAAARQNDAVRSAIFDLNKAIKEERYDDAAFIRDHAGAGLVGWWAGISTDAADPYGRIVHITAEHGRYVARSYTPRQIMSGLPGFPLFEIYFIVENGEYKRKAVYLRHQNTQSVFRFPKKSDSISSEISSISNDGESGMYGEEVKSAENTNEDNDISDGLAGLQSVLEDMIPGVKVTVLKVSSSEKVDSNLIEKVIDQIMAEDDEDDDKDLDNAEAYKDATIKSGSSVEIDDGISRNDKADKQIEVSVKLLCSNLSNKFSAEVSAEDLVRLPAGLARRDFSSFLFCIEQEDGKQENDVDDQVVGKKLSTQSEKDLSMSDLAKVFLGKEQISVKVLKDVGQLIRTALGRDQHRPLTGPMLFSRLQSSPSKDPLTGLFVGAHGSYTSEVLHMKHTFGQWKEDKVSQEYGNIQFYEYVEAVKLTGNLSLPAGEVAFRAKVGKRYQLPHEGIIPEEFGVIARYKGQGRIADPGFQNPRWVDGELVILDGKHIRGGPVIGFVYWTPGYPFLVFYNRLDLPE